MSKSFEGKIKLSSYSELVGDTGGEIIEVNLSELHEFAGHPFRVVDDERMQEMVESVQKHGVLVPGIVRHRKEGGYEIISGHRRRRACELAGLLTMPVVVKEYSEDQATVVMVDANIQREDILPSEKAKAYRMKYEAMKHQGSRTGGLSLDKIGATAGESGKTVQRYLWLSRLIDGLMVLVDQRIITFVCGIDLSWLSEEEQGWVLECIVQGKKVSKKKTENLKACAERKHLTKEVVMMILSAEKEKRRTFTLSPDIIGEFFGDEYTDVEIEEIVHNLLKYWKQNKPKRE